MLSPRDLRQLDPLAPLVAPSILAADFSRLGEQVRQMEAAGADVAHLDIMDGHFVPNLSLGPGVVSSIRALSPLPFDVHLMLAHPAAYVEPFVKAGADHITFHVESEDPIEATLSAIHRQGCSAGLSLRPGTGAEAVEPYLGLIDLILVMTVEPGFGGQSFMADMLPKIRQLREMIDAGDRGIHLEADGGIGADNAHLVREAGVNLIVAGTSVFRANGGMAQAIADIRSPQPS